MRSYELIDGVAVNKSYPKTFEIPTKEEKAAVKVGHHVKLGFVEPGKQPERMWVLVTKVDGDNFEGTLDNDPYALTAVKHGDTVTFNSEHIISTMT